LFDRIHRFVEGSKVSSIEF
jgi:hypothetical protein